MDNDKQQTAIVLASEYSAIRFEVSSKDERRKFICHIKDNSATIEEVKIEQ